MPKLWDGDHGCDKYAFWIYRFEHSDRKTSRLGWFSWKKRSYGEGVMLNTMEILKRLKKHPKKTTVAVQGFGNVGSIGRLY
ncbi:MAG: hypothetical protein V5A68_04760 [Candidatus Thermoplasmatota archaeon]